jgi:hypothetical protein
MTTSQQSGSVRGTGLLVGLAAVIAAVALLILALAYAGLLPGSGDAEPAVAVPTFTVAPSADGGGAGDLTEPTAALSSPAAAITAGAPTDAPVAPAGDLIVEDWGRFETAAALESAATVNVGWADNSLELDSIRVPDGERGVELGVVITAPPPNDYVGFEWPLAAIQDWRGYAHLDVPVTVVGSPQGALVVQWYETSGEVWRHRAPLPGASQPEVVRIPLAADDWEWADWSASVDGVMDPSAVSRVGLFVGHAGPTAGAVRVGTLRVANE